MKEVLKNRKIIEWVLRIAIAGEFLGHGAFALQKKAGWIPYFESVGISGETAMDLMPFIGIMDVAMAAIVLFLPIPIFLLWMAFWGFLTALIRPIAGQPIWDFLERWANWGAPLALFLMMGVPKKPKEWWKVKK